MHESVASKFGLTYAELAFLIYPDTTKLYREFTIPKKSGYLRTIHAPKYKLLFIQKIIASDLALKYVPKSSAQGFINGRSIVSNAKKHINKKYVFNVDLKDFFGSIHFGRVRNVLMTPVFGFSYIEATILSHICCHNGVLPQGAPTSPVLSNIICWKLDGEFQALARRAGCSYTRYADDITFSFQQSKASLPMAIVKIENGAIGVGDVVKKIIIENGFAINTSKVRLQGRNQRQEVTGLIVNKELNVKRSFIRKTRSMLHVWGKYGAPLAEKNYLDFFLERELLEWQIKGIQGKPGEHFKNVVKGRINFIQMVKGRENLVYRKLAYDLTKVLGKPNNEFLHSHLENAVVVIGNDMEQSQGSGFFLDGYGLVTNQHVVENLEEGEYEDFLDVHRSFDRGKKIQCSKLYVSKTYDVAFFESVEGLKKLTKLQRGDDGILCTGTKIKVLGFPSYSSKDSMFFAEGVITSKRDRFGSAVWLVDVPINHGASGGPVLNEKNEVIGIATYGKQSNDGSSEYNGFVPISNLDRIDKNNASEHSNASNSEESYEELLSVSLDACVKSCSKCKSQIHETREAGVYNCPWCAELTS